MESLVADPNPILTTAAQSSVRKTAQRRIYSREWLSGDRRPQATRKDPIIPLTSQVS